MQQHLPSNVPVGQTSICLSTLRYHPNSLVLFARQFKTRATQTLGDLEDKAEEGNALLEKQDLAAAHKVQFETQGPTRYNLKKRSPQERIQNFEVKLNLTCDSSKLSLFSFKIFPGVQWLSCQSGATSVATLPGYCQDSAKCTSYYLHHLPSFETNINIVNCFK